MNLTHSEQADAALTIGDVSGLVRVGGDRAGSVMRRMYRYSAYMNASPPYWYARQQELQAIIATKGFATLVSILSVADNHWEAFARGRSGLLPK